LPNNVSVNFHQFNMHELNNNENIIWKTMLMSIMRGISKHRNNVIFNNIVTHEQEIFSISQLKTWI